MSFKQEIKEELVSKRPNLTEKSLTAYVSTLSNLPKKIAGGENELSYFKKVDKIIEYLQFVPFNKRKSILVPLFILTGEKEYQDLMNTDIKEYNVDQLKQEKSEDQSENWLSWNEILEIYKKMGTQVASLYKVEDKKKNVIDDIERYVLLSFFILMKPRRAMDYSMMEFMGDGNVIDLKNKTATYRIYKTAKNYGAQTFPIPDALIKIIKKWRTINKSNKLLPNGNTSSQITTMLNASFKPKKVSVNMLRHAFLTHYYNGKMPSLEDMTETAKEMGHSVEQALKYIKN